MIGRVSGLYYLVLNLLHCNNWSNKGTKAKVALLVAVNGVLNTMVRICTMLSTDFRMSVRLYPYILSTESKDSRNDYQLILFPNTISTVV